MITTGLPSKRLYAPWTRQRGADAPTMPFAGAGEFTDAVSCWAMRRLDARPAHVRRHLQTFSPLAPKSALIPKDGDRRRRCRFFDLAQMSCAGLRSRSEPG